MATFLGRVKVIKCALAFERINGETAYISEALKLNSEVHSGNTRYVDIKLQEKQREVGRSMSPQLNCGMSYP